MGKKAIIGMVIIIPLAIAFNIGAAFFIMRALKRPDPMSETLKESLVEAVKTIVAKQAAEKKALLLNPEELIDTSDFRLSKWSTSLDRLKYNERAEYEATYSLDDAEVIQFTGTWLSLEDTNLYYLFIDDKLCAGAYEFYPNPDTGANCLIEHERLERIVSGVYGAATYRENDIKEPVGIRYSTYWQMYEKDIVATLILTDDTKVNILYLSYQVPAIKGEGLDVYERIQEVKSSGTKSNQWPPGEK